MRCIYYIPDKHNIRSHCAVHVLDYSQYSFYFFKDGERMKYR